ncbi:MAG: fibronectin type III domain-containing protein [Acidobacteriota bacterium]
MRPESIASSAARARDIVAGRIVAGTPRWGDARQAWIVTDYTVVIDDVIRSATLRPGQIVTVTIWGGTIGEEVWRIQGLAHPLIGDAFLFLLVPGGGVDRFTPVSHAMGLLALRAGADGDRVVRDHDGAPLQRGLDSLEPPQSGEADFDAVRAMLAETAYDPAASSDPARTEASPDLPASRPGAAHPYTWFGYWPGRIPIRPFGSWAGAWMGLERTEMDKWGYYADVWDVRAPADFFYPRDGVVDLAGWQPSSNLLQAFGYAWEPNVVGITFSYTLGLLIVDATVALNPAYAWTTNDAAIYRGDSAAISFAFTMLHELGHVVGLDHSFFRLSVMNYPPIGFDAAAMVYRDDAVGLRALYPTRAVPRTDIGVHLYWHGPGAGDFRDAAFPASVSAGSAFSINNWVIENTGTTTVSPSVEFWLQSALDPAAPAVFLRSAAFSPPLPPGFSYDPLSTTATVTVPVSTPPGAYHLLMHVRGDGGPVTGRFPFGNNWGYSRRRITISGAGLAPPTNLAATVTGSTVTFNWRHPASGAPPGYLLEAGSAPGLANLAALPLAGALTTFATTAPPGTFYVRLRSTSGSASSAPSNEVVVTVGAGPGQVPGPPASISASVIGRTITVTWTPPTAGTVTGYLLEAGSAPGLANLVEAPVGLTTSYTAANVPPGTYYIRVRALNDAGIGPPSADVAVSVP